MDGQPRKGEEQVSIGRVFTPLVWAKWAAVRGGLVAKWLSGSSVLDPTLGTGQLLAALVELALEAGHSLKSLPFSRLFGVEIDPETRLQALDSFRRSYGVDMEGQFLCADLFESKPVVCDLLFGNPPWITFGDLPFRVKAAYKARFLQSGLVPDARKLLLGGSRIDVAALVVQKTLADWLAPGGEAWFFLPLSLFLNDGAHAAFRNYRTPAGPFSPFVLCDFGDESVFGSVATRYALAGFRRDTSPVYPITYEQMEKGRWRRREARPAFGPTDPLSIGDPGAAVWTAPGIPVEKRSVPRQGVNTGGANSVFFFDRCEPAEGGLCRAGGRLLPRVLVHPLITSDQFRDPAREPRKWVLIPHGPDGRPLDQASLEALPSAFPYLAEHRAVLEARKGALVGAWKARGRWWALLGVGPYSFAPYKIVWEAYGRQEFRPRLFSGDWQVNQALQAYIPCWDEATARRLLEELSRPSVEAYLRSMNMPGTMNWAQPGKIRRLLEVGG